MLLATTPWIVAAVGALLLGLLATGGLAGHARVAAATLPSSLLALACVLTRLRSLVGAEKKTWRYIAGSLVAWIALDIGAFFHVEPGLAVRAAGTFCIATLFMAMVLALDGRSLRTALESLPLAHALERIGAVVFAFGLLLYALGGSDAPPEAGFEFARRCLILLFLLYLMARLVLRARASRVPGGPSAYLALAIGTLLVAVSVAMALAAPDRALPLRAMLRSGGPLAILAATILASRIDPLALSEDWEPPAPGADEPLALFWSGPLMAYAAAFPALHLAGYGLGVLDPSLRNGREIMALVLLFGLGALALWHLKELERQADEATRRFLLASEHDPFTGLASRSSFLERVARSLSRVKRLPGYHFAVLVVELERFNLIENAFGPRFARDLVVGLSERFKKCLRPGDMVASLGQDRFAVLADHIHAAHAVRDLGEIAQRIGGSVIAPLFAAVPEASHGPQAAEIAQRILRDGVSPPIAVDAREVFPRGSIGIATSDAAYGDAEELLRDAQVAVRRAKLRGGDTFEMFDPDMQAESLARVVVESELHRAVERGELLLEYQPIVRLDEAEIAGFEALLRWRHPTRGVLKPADFLSAADTTGLILPITRWVIHEACQRAAEWQELTGRPLFVSCNVAGPQFRAGGLQDAVSSALRSSGLSGRQLKLEITEGVAIASFDAVVAAIADLSGAGVEFLLDDFGTGYSSLSYLHRLPVKGLKIDGSFVLSLPHDNASVALVRGIVELAKELGRDVIAEGIETAGQRDSLRELGCVYGQGFYLGMPAEAGLLAAVLTQTAGRPS